MWEKYGNFLNLKKKLNISKYGESFNRIVMSVQEVLTQLVSNYIKRVSENADNENQAPYYCVQQVLSSFIKRLVTEARLLGQKVVYPPVSWSRHYNH